ncbi:MAG: hypothetical protein ACI9A7_001982 [Cyclobacteriaceae bacterium]|jgi:hypothetical protein
MRIKSKVVSDQFDGEVVVVSLESGAYYSIRETAQEIWSLIENNVSRSGIINSFSNLTDEETDKIESYLDFLLLEELIDEDDTQVESDTSNSLNFVGLTYSKFDDMSDLIMIDPIHDADEEKGWPNKVEEDKG